MENHLLAIESIGLLGLLDKDLFNNYSRIFSAILQDSLEQDRYNTHFEDDAVRLKCATIALKSSIDGLLFYRTNDRTEALRQLILDRFMFSKEKKLRQITIEGICKMLFSIQITKDVKSGERQNTANANSPMNGQDKNENEEESANEGTITIISHLIIQWFDKKFNCQKSLVR